MRDRVWASVSERRFQTWLIGAFAASALLLSCLGVYGVVSYSVAQRTSEIGVRMALGAHASEVRRQVLAEGMKPVLIGLAAGLAAAAWAATLLREALFQVSPFDTATFLLAPALLCASAWLACVIPARRAARVAPMTVLRYE